MEKNKIFVFSPKGGEKDIVNLCPDGEVLNLWPKSESYAYHVYKPGNPGEGGKISTVPEKYTEEISNAKRDGRFIEAVFLDVGVKKTVKIEIFSKEASEEIKKQQRELFIDSITKKYNPKKPLNCEIELFQNTRIMAGDKIFIKPMGRECYEKFYDIYDVIVWFVNKEGNDVGKLSHHIKDKQKILRAHFNGYVLDISILSVSDNKGGAVWGRVSASIEINFLKKHLDPSRTVCPVPPWEFS